MAMAGPASDNTILALQQRITLGAIALCVVYSAGVMLWASPVSFYTLDDPYIHMGLAENIVRGHFGVNLGEVSNPSSSILWPWLMAGFEIAGVMLWAPLLVNIACFAASVWIVVPFALRRMAPDGAHVMRALIVLGLAFLAFNLFGVIFTGMEHSLHVLLCVVVVTRVIDGRYDGLALAALALGPLVRFEGAIILALGVGAALYDRKWVFALAAVALPAAAMGAYALWLTGLGLPMLPSSVLSKSASSSSMVDGGGGALQGLLASLGENLRQESAVIIAVLAAGMVYAAVKRSGRDRVLALGIIGVLLLALMLGKMNSYGRYEVYVLAVAGLAALHLLQGELRMVLATPARAIMLGVGLLAVAPAGMYAFLTTPQAARNIHRQQYQMHRLITECWQQPVAINDLGWASFRNDAYVLDLYGLGSEEARKARAAGELGWMTELVEGRSVGAAMIYTEWFPDRPETWTHVGDIDFTEMRVTIPSPRVAIYATTQEAIAPLSKCLEAMADSMPPGSMIQSRTDT
ncbi:MAG: hypothetical protein Q8R82_09220 [Hyphomonadaceae bacterium]|nr:hypothetical protein [Hyphomonadaceae bacterium]